MITKKHITENYDKLPIAVEFLVIHYSATSLNGVFRIFANKQAGVSSHFVISEDGRIFETVPCLGDHVCRAWHAGISNWHNGRKWNNFNDLSIGIELINLNGNIFPYTPIQIDAVKWLIDLLKHRFPKLNDPNRILGHEQIAGHRGKVDPGIMFDWKDIFRSCYGNCMAPERRSVLPGSIAVSLAKHLQKNKLKNIKDDLFWQQLNTAIEHLIRTPPDDPGQISWPHSASLSY